MNFTFNIRDTFVLDTRNCVGKLLDCNWVILIINEIQWKNWNVNLFGFQSATWYLICHMHTCTRLAVIVYHKNEFTHIILPIIFDYIRTVCLISGIHAVLYRFCTWVTRIRKIKGKLLECRSNWLVSIVQKEFIKPTISSCIDNLLS